MIHVTFCRGKDAQYQRLWPIHTLSSPAMCFLFWTFRSTFHRENSEKRAADGVGASPRCPTSHVVDSYERPNRKVRVTPVARVRRRGIRPAISSEPRTRFPFHRNLIASLTSSMRISRLSSLCVPSCAVLRDVKTNVFTLSDESPSEAETPSEAPSDIRPSCVVVGGLVVSCEILSSKAGITNAPRARSKRTSSWPFIYTALYAPIVLVIGVSLPTLYMRLIAIVGTLNCRE